MADTGWVAECTGPGFVHVRPLGDLIGHDKSPDCPCGPRAELVTSGDGPDGWMHVHNSLDNRESRPSPAFALTVDSLRECRWWRTGFTAGGTP